MHIYFSGIGGTGIGPLALIAHQSGLKVTGSDQKTSEYTEYLTKKGLNIHIGQSNADFIAATHKNEPIDWYVYSSALPLEHPDHPELVFVKNKRIKHTKRDEFLNYFIEKNSLKLVAAAGTHGKTTTTAMLVWVFGQLGIPISYSVGAKTEFCEMGHFDKKSEYFIYECDEFDKNFLSFYPHYSVVSSIDWDHHEIYGTRDLYKQAFRQFIGQSKHIALYDDAFTYLGLSPSPKVTVVSTSDKLLSNIGLAGQHNRANARLCLTAVHELTKINNTKLIDIVNGFPGTSRRFEKLAKNIYTDYAHTPEEIKATLQMAQEISNDIMVVYEPLTNRRQHYMQTQYADTFKGVTTLYWLPSYLAREDPRLEIITPAKLIAQLNNKEVGWPAEKGKLLANKITEHANKGGLALLIAGGGGGSLDEWARLNLG